MLWVRVEYQSPPSLLQHHCPRRVHYPAGTTASGGFNLRVGGEWGLRGRTSKPRQMGAVSDGLEFST